MASPGKKSYPLRIDPALWVAIERLAAQELRSANAQVEFLLREGLARRGRLPPDTNTLDLANPASAPHAPEVPDASLDLRGTPPLPGQGSGGTFASNQRA